MDVNGVPRTDSGVWMQWVAVAVQPGDGYACAREDAEVVVAGGVADEDVAEGRHVHRWQKSAGVDLDAGQSQVGNDGDGFGQRPVVQDCVVEAELHTVSFEYLLT